MFFSMKFFFTFIVAVLVVQASTFPLYEDSDVAASGDDHHGRVQIKVYRGPTTHEGHDHFAPWGFWVKQPADEDHH